MKIDFYYFVKIESSHYEYEDGYSHRKKVKYGNWKEHRGRLNINCVTKCYGSVAYG